MTSGLAWLNELMIWLGKWFPRLVLVKSTHIGVKFGRKGAVASLPQGLYCYWPITTEITLVGITRRTSEIACQLCGDEVISLAVAYTITDPKTTLVDLHDVFSYLDDLIQGQLAAAYVKADTNDAIAGRVLEAIRADLTPHGVSVESVRIIQRGWALPLKNLNDWAQHGKAVLA
jgi:hypothetical protein